MTMNKHHITDYKTYGWVLAILLFLTALTVYITWFDLKALTIAAALVIASVKVTIVLTYFMHLKYDSLVLRLMVAMVFLLIALVFVLTFFDYLFR
ncbi:MAG: hypothetical protein A2033_08680 [Bacteroidetes bacterium GWA2_31_9]|nr:MAG: hypothetical protein A2033_08680 [Bacteroidetes bacterium GWA2_31_9]